METRQLGNTELHITPIGFGAWAIGGGGWAFLSDAETAEIDAFRRANP